MSYGQGHVLRALPSLMVRSEYRKQSHVIYKFDYHIVWVPKYRLRILKGAIKELVDSDIRSLCEWKSCEVIELTCIIHKLDHTSNLAYNLMYDVWFLKIFENIYTV